MNNKSIFVYTKPAPSLAAFEDLRRSGAYTDLYINVRGSRFPVHKCILAASIEYFRRIFVDNEVVGIPPATKETMTFRNFSAEDFKKILDYAYAEHVVITKDELPRVVAIAHFFQMRDFVERSLKFIEYNLPIFQSNLSQIFILKLVAVPISTNLAEKCVIYGRENFDQISVNEDFLNYDIELLAGILSVESRFPKKMLFDGTIRWIIKDYNHRNKHLFQLLKLIKLTIIDLQLINSYFYNNETAMENHLMRELKENVIYFCRNLV